MGQYISQENIQKLWEKIKAFKNGYQIIYDNPQTNFPNNTNGQTKTLPITLEQSCFNFNKIIIEAITVNNQFVVFELLHPRPNKNFLMNNWWLEGGTSNSSWTTIEVFECTISTNGMNINQFGYCGKRRYGNASSTYTAGDFMFITKVIGVNGY